MINNSCPVCQSQELEVLLDSKVAHPLWWRSEYPDTSELKYQCCLNCGYIFLYPRYSLEEYKDIYSKTPGLNRQEILSARRKMLEARKCFIENNRQSNPKGTILEVGAAYGDFLNLFTSYERRIGIEPSETYVKQAKKEESGIEYHSYMLESLLDAEPNLEAKADLAMACHVLEHALDPVVFVQKLSQLVKPEGEIFIEVPSLEGMSEIETPLYQNLYFGHVSQFSIPVLTRIAVQCGLLPVCVQYSVNDKYPVIQALFKKGESPNQLVARFKQHADNVFGASNNALKNIRKILENNSVKKVLVWGCGQDLFDLVSKFDDDLKQSFTHKCDLVDRNTEKQGCTFAGLSILSPDKCFDKQYDLIVIANRSEIITRAIRNDCGIHFKNVDIRQLFYEEE